MKTPEERQEIAKIILAQLGGNKFRVMTGAKSFVATDSGLGFRLPSRFAKNGINVVKITLTPDDLYNMQFAKLIGSKFKVISEVEGLCWEDLRCQFTAATGLDTSMGKIFR